MCLDSLPERGRANDHLLLHRFTINHLASGYHKLPSLSSSNEDTEEAVALRLLYLCINCRLAVICKSTQKTHTAVSASITMTSPVSPESIVIIVHDPISYGTLLAVMRFAGPVTLWHHLLPTAKTQKVAETTEKVVNISTTKQPMPVLELPKEDVYILYNMYVYIIYICIYILMLTCS